MGTLPYIIRLPEIIKWTYVLVVSKIERLNLRRGMTEELPLFRLLHYRQALSPSSSEHLLDLSGLSTAVARFRTVL